MAPPRPKGVVSPPPATAAPVDSEKVPLKEDQESIFTLLLLRGNFLTTDLGEGEKASRDQGELSQILRIIPPSWKPHRYTSFKVQAPALGVVQWKQGS